jgi:uncharacterized protein (TIGR02145 family)
VPTLAEYDALLAASTEKWGPSGGINGTTITSTNGSLFFSAAGLRYWSISTYQTSYGFYWTSTQANAIAANSLYFDSTNPGYTSASNKYDARPIRCVRPYTAPPVVNPVGEVLVEGTYRTVYWAKSNVGTTVKTFASAATNYGGYYQWDDDTPYTYTGGTTPPENNSTAETWQSANNPCPTGWEVPTYQDYADLFATSTETWGPSGTINGLNVVAPNGTLFFPAGGYRTGSTSSGQTTLGDYWSSEQYSTTNARHLWFSGDSPNLGNATKSYAIAVRCIRLKLE